MKDYLTKASMFKTVEDANRETLPWTPSEEQLSRRKRLQGRMEEMLQMRRLHEPQMKRAILEYEGRSRQNPDDPRDETFVVPIAFQHVEQKTAEEVQMANSYEIIPVDDASDAWKVELLDDARKHLEAKTKFFKIYYEWHRQKNIFGVGIIRHGYRRIEGVIHDPIVDPATGEVYDWEEKTVDKYNDLFFDLISPFDFLIDPNAMGLDDAEDCAMTQVMNWNAFQQIYCNNPLYENTEHVRPGQFDKENKSSIHYNISSSQVLITEYFNHITDEWVMYANDVEIRKAYLPDKHKMLPFAAIHNHPNYVLDSVDTAPTKIDVDLGTAASAIAINTRTTFWTKGDPERIRDLTVLRTDFARAAARNAKLNGESIIATAPGRKFDPRKQWRSGDQAVGMMGQFQAVSLGNSNMANFDYMFNMLDDQITRTLGVDSRILGDTKTKTAEEVATQREQGMKRLVMGVKLNQAGGISRLGRLVCENIQQYYTIPLLKRLSGKEDLTIFDEVENDPRTGKPLYGKKYRRITTNKLFREEKDNRKKNPYLLKRASEEEGGKHSFIARGEYIRTSEYDIRVLGAMEAAEIKVVQRQQYMRALELTGQLLVYVQAGIMKIEDLPNVKLLSQKIMETFSIPKSEATNMDEKSDKTEEETIMEEYLSQQNIPTMMPNESGTI